MKDRTKDSTPGGGRTPPRHSSQDAFIDFIDSLPTQFKVFHKKLSGYIQRDLDAKVAFEKITSGRWAMDAKVLLLRLAAEAYAIPADKGPEKPGSRYANKSQERRSWEKWTDALQGLESNAKTLRRVSKQMKAYLAEAKNDLPGEFGYSMRLPRGQIFQILFQHIPRSAMVLSEFAEKLDVCANTIEAYCTLGKVWRQVAAQSDEVEIQSTFALLQDIEEKTGHRKFEQMAKLINVGRRLRGRKEETEESLRSMWRRESKRQKHIFYLRRRK